MNLFKLFLFTLLFTTFNASSYTVFSSYGSCKVWNQYIKNENNDKDSLYSSNLFTSSLMGWLAGFATAVNMSTGEENFPNIDLETMKEYIVSYCEKNPTGDAYDAVFEIRKKLKK
ncbi:hypothetical protein PGS49_21495 [Yersinia intermedia]|uniref:hypothetical protein n=1 Tax=Yersinia intermedia TaxID=631 RepID=UPI0022FF050F|nr:hypothetical protein [Yersinia intermedia]MDA5483194.1 hypothetical protein [Yersinia intermedia]